MNIRYLFSLMICVISMSAVANSPYENRLLSGDMQRVGLVAFADKAQIPELQQLATKLPSNSPALKKNDIVDLSIYFREINNQVMVFAYFESPSKDITGWEKRLMTSSTDLALFSQKLSPHKRANLDEVWLRMEWINLVASDKVFPYNGKKPQKMGLVSGLKLDSELQYRQLHQNNWPGVVDGMVLSNYRNWTTFLVEVGAELYLFTYAEYIGDDINVDNAKMAADPTTQRWWTHTEECLINLHGEGNWSSMTPFFKAVK